MEHYVTLFDSLFLPQGLALHASMERQIKEYTLWVLCVDDQTYDVLNQLKLPNVRLLQLSKLETEALLRVKKERKKGEYCWTLTPFAPRFVFEADPAVQRVTYIDADLWFCKSPTPLLKDFESSGKQVLITEHGYAPEYDQSATSGIYCVQFMTFTREGGEKVRKWWEERCIEWCFDYTEDGKFGDQKYLDDWPTRFANEVHVASNNEWTLAPWNAIRFPVSGALFFHFHEFKIMNQNKALIGDKYLPPAVKEYIYTPYAKDIRAAIDKLATINFEIRPQTNGVNSLKRLLLVMRKKLLQLRDVVFGPKVTL